MTTDTVDDMNDPQSNAIQAAAEDDWKVDPTDIAFAEKTTAVPAATFQEPTAVSTETETGWGDEADLLPDGAGGRGNDEWDTDGEEEIDLSDLRINLSKQEADAESFEDLVAGKYRVAIFAGKVERSKSSKNPGKPMYNLTYKVQDGKYKGAQMYDRLCLWSGAAYSYVMLVKALGFTVAEGSIPVVPLNKLLGRTMIVRYGMGKRNTVVNQATGETTVYEARLQVKGYYADKTLADPNSATAADPLAP